jgi:hypothetical protein
LVVQVFVRIPTGSVLRGNQQFGDIFLLLIGDKLKTVGLNPSKVGLISLMLDRDEVLSATEQADSTTPPEGWMSADQLAERLCAHKNTVYALLRKGYIEPSVFRTQRNYPKQGATRDAVAAFAATHVTLAECIKRTGLHQMKVMSILEAGGVGRVFPRDELREMLLPREEAEAVLSLNN